MIVPIKGHFEAFGHCFSGSVNSKKDWKGYNVFASKLTHAITIEAVGKDKTADVAFFSSGSPLNPNQITPLNQLLEKSKYGVTQLLVL